MEKERKLDSKSGLLKIFVSGAVLLSSFAGIYEGCQYLSTEATNALEPIEEIIGKLYK